MRSLLSEDEGLDGGRDQLLDVRPCNPTPVRVLHMPRVAVVHRAFIFQTPPLERLCWYRLRGGRFAPRIRTNRDLTKWRECDASINRTHQPCAIDHIS